MKLLAPAAVFAGFVVLALLCDAAIDTTHLPLSSAVLGLIVFTVVLLLRRRIDPPVEEAANALLSWFPLLFVPAAVGVMAFGTLLLHSWLGVAAAIIIATLLGITVAATVGTTVARALGEEP
jgi:holin-like protein